MDSVFKFFKDILKLLVKSETETTAGRVNAFGMIVLVILLLVSSADTTLKTIINGLLAAFGKEQLPGFSSTDILIGFGILAVLTGFCVWVVQPVKQRKR